MDELVKKIEAYNLFNYLVPGVVGSEIITWLLHINIRVDVFVDFFAFYFMGLIISRIGALIVGPVLRRTKLIVFEPYKDYLSAAKRDPKFELMSQENNVYRTYVSMGIVVFATFIYSYIKHLNPVVRHYGCEFMLMGISLIILMFFAYRRQSDFVVRRIKIAR